MTVARSRDGGDGRDTLDAPARPGERLLVTFYDTMPTPVGVLLLTADESALTGVLFEKSPSGHRPAPEWRRADEAPDAESARVLAAAREQLDEYFAGRLTAFTLPIAPRGTGFQQRVWAVLRGIPFGETISYLDLARRLGDPSAVRAVGGANGRNPIPIVVPCHRVVGADGSLTGFGGGVERKRWLLQHEGALAGGTQLPLWG